MERAGVARFPGARGRIPNFAGAQDAAERLARTETFESAQVLKCNPDTPQRPVRALALAPGKVVYMAVPKLAELHPFVRLDPVVIPRESHWRAASKAGAERWGRPVQVADMEPVDLIVTGCVAVSPSGARLGKGGGYSDLEFALLREGGRITAATHIVSTVHPLQIVADGEIEMTPHDISLDAYCSPHGEIRCARAFERPVGVIDDALDPEKRAAIPVLRDRAGS